LVIVLNNNNNCLFAVDLMVSWLQTINITTINGKVILYITGYSLSDKKLKHKFFKQFFSFSFQIFHFSRCAVPN